MSLEQYYSPHYRDYRWPVAALLKCAYAVKVRKWTQGRIAGRVLEVGCGAGWMLSLFQKCGWETVGVEREELAERAANNLSTPIFGNLKDVEALRQTFDLVIFHQVLEHLPDPLESLKLCYGLLAPGGRLIAEVPNIDSVQSKFSKAHWVHLDVPRHLYHFSKRSLEECLSRAGFRDNVVSKSVGIHDVFGWLQSGLNWMGFPQNLLLRWLMGERGLLCTASGLVMLSVMFFMFPLVVGATLFSALQRDGVVIDAVGVK
jgi:SAM-dependent methyltransferase